MKVAISLPDDVFEAGEHLAQQLGISRSQLYASALSAFLSTRGARAITAKLNEVYAKHSSELDPAIARSQSALLVNETW